MENTRSCHQCCGRLIDNKPICSVCGRFQSSFTYKSRVAAVALAMFGGMFGLHRFYLGQWWLGLIYCLFAITFIPWLVALVEGIAFMLSSQKNWNERYNQGLDVGYEKTGVVFAFLLCIPAFPVFMVWLIAISGTTAGTLSRDAKVEAIWQQAQSIRASMEQYEREHGHAAYAIDRLDLEIMPVAVQSCPKIVAGAVVIGLQGEGQLVYGPANGAISGTWDCQGSTLPSHFLPKPCGSVGLHP